MPSLVAVTLRISSTCSSELLYFFSVGIFKTKEPCLMSLQTRSNWRTRVPQASFGVAGVILATLFVLAFSSLSAYAATTHISTDPFTQATCAASATTNHHTEVEPDTFSNGSTIVSTFQVGRVFDGGACAIGFATSTNNGASWTNGLLPGITKWTGGGSNDRATDPSVAYDARHNVWLISSLTLLEAGGVPGKSGRTTRLTYGGLSWRNPSTTATRSQPDKNCSSFA